MKEKIYFTPKQRGVIEKILPLNKTIKYFGGESLEDSKKVEFETNMNRENKELLKTLKSVNLHYCIFQSDCGNKNNMKVLISTEYIKI